MACRPNRSTGTRARLVAQEESCWGTVSSSEAAIGIDFASESLVNDINSIQSQLIRADRMNPAGQQGNQRPGGDIVGELQPHGWWALAMRHALGGAVTTVGSNPYTHSLAGDVDIPADPGDSIQGLTIEKRFGFPDGTYKWLQYRGCMVNEFQMTVPTEGIVTSRAGIIARQEYEAADNMDASPSYPTNNEPFNSFQGSILMDQNGDGTRTAIATLTSWDMTINNSVDGDQFAIDGTAYRADTPADLRLITGNMDAFFTDTNWQLYQAFLANTSLSIDLTLTRGSYSWRIVIPQFKIRGQVTPKVGGRGPMNIPMQWEAHRDDTLGTDIQVTITNTDSVLSTAA